MAGCLHWGFPKCDVWFTWSSSPNNWDLSSFSSLSSACSPALSFWSSLYLFPFPHVSLPSVLACTGEASSGRPGVGGQQHDKDHRVWSLRAGHLVPLSIPRGIRPPGEALHVRVLPEVYEEPDHSAQAHGKSAFSIYGGICRSLKKLRMAVSEINLVYFLLTVP